MAAAVTFSVGSIDVIIARLVISLKPTPIDRLPGLCLAEAEPPRWREMMPA